MTTIAKKRASRKAPGKTELAHEPTGDRLLDAAVDIYGGDPKDLRYLHVVLAQCGLPYREQPKGERDYFRKNGNATLVLSAGHLLDPKTQVPVLQGIPYGPKPRLLMIHLCTEAVIHKSPHIDVGASMSAFMRDLGLAVTGGKRGTIGAFKEQMNRLAASRIQLLFADETKVSMRNPAPAIHDFDFWFPKNPDQQMLWPTTATLSNEFYESLLAENALPLDVRAVRGLQQSAMALDIYSWLSHRLRRIPDHNPVSISWGALQRQFGPDIARIDNFRRDFKESLAKVLALYRGAKVTFDSNGIIQLRQSPPPVQKVISTSKGKM